MEFSIYRLDYISSVYIHTHVGLVSAVPGALVTTRPCEDRAYKDFGILVTFTPLLCFDALCRLFKVPFPSPLPAPLDSRPE